MTRMSAFGAAAVSALALALSGAAHAASEPQSQAATMHPVHRVDPEFPRAAALAGVPRGLVTARMTLDPGGNVTRVEIVDAVPRRLFDRAVIQALSQWRYAEGAAGRVVEIEIGFQQ